ncbi:MAG: septal ring lytic transglycosylase RlpA family protein [Myxococcales bacterium]|nr:septal ring lytic transglycosylase RlpA family protein [Myxococcales bacterium]
MRLATAALLASLGLTLGCGGSRREPRFQPPVGAAETRASSQPRRPGDLDFAHQASVPSDVRPMQVGQASWYGKQFAGRKTASGERFDPSQLTAAHRTLPFGTWVDVRRIDTGTSVRVRITDRGPFGDKRRIIDVSHKAAEQLGMVRDGVAEVELRVVRGP